MKGGIQRESGIGLSIKSLARTDEDSIVRGRERDGIVRVISELQEKEKE